MARELRRPMSGGQAIGRGLSRQARAPSTDRQIQQMEDRYGRAEAARRAGVSERTWRRWRAGGAPSRANARRLDQESRAARISSRRRARLTNRGAYVRLSGNVGGGTPGARRKNTRHRTIGGEGQESIHLTGAQMERIIERYEAGDDQGALDALQEAIRDTPWGSDFGNLEFEDLTRLEFLRDDPNA